jgi:nucleotide-binding universal stress UspA family protein
VRFLVALYNEKTVKQLVQFTALLAGRLGTDLTFIYVEPEVKLSQMQEMQMAQDKLSEWKMDSRGLSVLRLAREHLMNMGIITERRGEGMMRRLINEAGDFFVQYTGAEEGINKVTFRYRQGDGITEILEEVNENHHEIITIGSAKDSDFLTKLFKFSPSSILVVKNPQDIKYKLLAATDGTPPAHRAELLAIKTASVLNMELTFLSVTKNAKEKEFMDKHLKRMTGICEMKGVKYHLAQREGNIVDHITETAGEDHLIFLGRSRRNPLAKLFLGSKTISVVQKANCPLLVLK